MEHMQKSYFTKVLQKVLYLGKFVRNLKVYGAFFSAGICVTSMQ